MAAATPIKIVKRALWRPGWYRLDQPIGVGQFGRFAFFDPTAESASQPPWPENGFGSGPIELQFFNRTITDQKHPLFRFARVLEIIHPQLGPLERVDTSGLDYVFKPADGEEIYVNAEEEPGVAYDFDQPVGDWSLLVTLDDVSEPIADAVV